MCETLVGFQTKIRVVPVFEGINGTYKLEDLGTKGPDILLFYPYCFNDKKRNSFILIHTIHWSYIIRELFMTETGALWYTLCV